jgi:hypothetical protein
MVLSYDVHNAWLNTRRWRGSASRAGRRPSRSAAWRSTRPASPLGS